MNLIKGLGLRQLDGELPYIGVNFINGLGLRKLDGDCSNFYNTLLVISTVNWGEFLQQILRNSVGR